MASTQDVPLADFSRYHSNHCRPASIPADARDDAERDVVVTRSLDVENAWRTDENMPADVGEREQVNLPRADGGTEALVWGRL